MYNGNFINKLVAEIGMHRQMMVIAAIFFIEFM